MKLDKLYATHGKLGFDYLRPTSELGPAITGLILHTVGTNCCALAQNDRCRAWNQLASTHSGAGWESRPGNGRSPRKPDSRRREQQQLARSNQPVAPHIHIIDE